MALVRRHVLALVTIAALAAPARADDVADALRRENQALRARLAALEAEVAELRVLAGVAAAPGREADSAARVATAFDERRGTTSVTGRASRLEVLHGVRGRHWMTLRYQHPGRDEARSLEAIELALDATSSRAAYGAVRTLRLSLDGEPVECRVVGYRSTAETVGSGQRQVGVREEVVVEVPRPVLARVARASDVRAALGPTEFRLTPEQVVEFRVFERRLGG
jgi:hypothetical protein